MIKLMNNTTGEQRCGLRVAVYGEGGRANIELNGAAVLLDGRKLQQLLETVPARARVVIGVDGDLGGPARAVLERWKAAYEADGGDVELTQGRRAVGRGRRRERRTTGRMIINRWRHGL